jgi:hypothetical protein
MTVPRKARARASEARLDLSDSGLTTLENLPIYPDLEELVLDNNQLTTFAGLKVQPKLSIIRARNNPDLEWLNGLPKQPNLTELDLRETAIASKPAYRVKTLATIGEKLMVLDGCPLTRTEQKSALTFKNQNKVFLQEEGESIKDDIAVEDLAVFNELHAKEHSEFFDAFAENEAILWELKECGALPYIDETSTSAELCAAIEHIRNRIEQVRRKIEELRGCAS